MRGFVARGYIKVEGSCGIITQKLCLAVAKTGVSMAPKQ